SVLVFVSALRQVYGGLRGELSRQHPTRIDGPEPVQAQRVVLVPSGGGLTGKRRGRAFRGRVSGGGAGIVAQQQGGGDTDRRHRGGGHGQDGPASHRPRARWRVQCSSGLCFLRVDEVVDRLGPGCGAGWGGAASGGAVEQFHRTRPPLGVLVEAGGDDSAQGFGHTGQIGGGVRDVVQRLCGGRTGEGAASRRGEHEDRAQGEHVGGRGQGVPQCLFG